MNRVVQARAARRAHLLAAAASQRRRLALNVAPLREPLALADRGLSVVHYVRHHPVLLVVAGALLVLARPRRAVTWLRRGWMGWLLLKGNR